MALHARIKADGSHAIVFASSEGRPQIDSFGAILIEDDGDESFFGWEDFEIISVD